MKTATELRSLLDRIDRKGYPAYKDTKGEYRFDGYVLSIDHVQGDPFASPSKVSVRVAAEKGKFPGELFAKPHQRIALQDYLVRQFGREVDRYAFQAKGSGKSGLMSVSRCGQEILERTACTLEPKSGDVLLRLEIGFPANGRTVNSRELVKILFEFLPKCVEKALFYGNLDTRKVIEAVKLAEDQHFIREQLPSLGLAAFVANGAVLPRESGVSQRPMRNAVKFQSPSSMEVTLILPNHGTISGMGIRKGITLIVGGGYHGKSTLLKALELGVYDHIGGDGREYVVTDCTAVKIRAEDGRSIKRSDISMFINDLPNEKDTTAFFTEDASGSTSQAANVIEAMEAGAGVFLIDEDTSATNFMIRDELMQRVIHREMEPITPFIERVKELYEVYDVSSVLVAGSSGAYFHMADTIVQMERYVPKDITILAKKEAEDFPVLTGPGEAAKAPVYARCANLDQAFRRDARIKIKSLGKDAFQLNRETVDLRYVEQLTDAEQTVALGYLVKYAQMHLLNGKKDLREVVRELLQFIEASGLAGICENVSNVAALAMPREQEIFACFNRYRGLKL